MKTETEIQQMKKILAFFNLPEAAKALAWVLEEYPTREDATMKALRSENRAVASAEDMPHGAQPRRNDAR